jgi:hypothetical protein
MARTARRGRVVADAHKVCLTLEQRIEQGLQVGQQRPAGGDPDHGEAGFDQGQGAVKESALL